MYIMVVPSCDRCFVPLCSALRYMTAVMAISPTSSRGRRWASEWMREKDRVAQSVCVVELKCWHGHLIGWVGTKMKQNFSFFSFFEIFFQICLLFLRCPNGAGRREAVSFQRVCKRWINKLKYPPLKPRGSLCTNRCHSLLFSSFSCIVTFFIVSEGPAGGNVSRGSKRE